jgi:formate-dependent nitrite reductase membrane component NrfD
MDTDVDLLLTVGIVLLVLSIPSLLSAWVESRAPRLGAIMVIGALGMIVTALITKPGGYAFNDIPGVMVKVISGFVQ